MEVLKDKFPPWKHHSQSSWMPGRKGPLPLFLAGVLVGGGVGGGWERETALAGDRSLHPQVRPSLEVIQ